MPRYTGALLDPLVAEGIPLFSPSQKTTTIIPTARLVLLRQLAAELLRESLAPDAAQINDRLGFAA